ncbi:hypothetical protein [Burkholderia sp. Ac-20365]|jgi:hypothetical protein|uniref:hypothetical protein n=1 Tax=Burkholderia sp. Ac-20365 TaxID=2703897 RepID=UPI00197C4672|nr:hypothetical protein [Burkholderia sp. Ac-20365]MBN3760740.1 hypothetical protein [Burkholderia sp. Ac-20365]
MRAQPLAAKVERRLLAAAQRLGTADPVAPIQGLIERTFPLPDGDERYGNNALTPMSAPIEPNFSELQPGSLRFTIEPLGPGASGADRRDEATREMRRLVGSFFGRDALRWFDERSEAWRGFASGGALSYGAFFGTSYDRDGLAGTRVYYETRADQMGAMPPGLTRIVSAVRTLMPTLQPLFTTISAMREAGAQRLTFVHSRPVRLADFQPVLDALGLGHQMPGILQTLGLTLGGRFDLPASSTLVAFSDGADGPEFEIYVMLGMISDLPANFMSLLSLGLNERPRELVALERWLDAFTPEDEVWPGRFSILSLRTSRNCAPRVSLYLRPAEFELPAGASRNAP